jgi:leader peptidase (prepilin peptidase)/N-methyltransferase
MPIAAPLLLPLWVLLGMAVGSFINAAADRIPARQSLLSPPSHCEACGRRLGPAELVPVLSYLILRGRCRNCGASIGVRTLFVEIATGLLFGLAAYVVMPAEAAEWLSLLLISYYLATLILVTIADLEHGLVPNRAVVPGIGAALLGATVAGWPDGLYDALGGLIGAGVIALIILLVPAGMGWGDAKLAGFIGLITGLPGILFALFIAFVSGGLVAAALMASGKRRRGDTIPLGPFLALGGAATLLCGEQMEVAFHVLAGG